MIRRKGKEKEGEVMKNGTDKGRIGEEGKGRKR